MDKEDKALDALKRVKERISKLEYYGDMHTMDAVDMVLEDVTRIVNQELATVEPSSPNKG